MCFENVRGLIRTIAMLGAFGVLSLQDVNSQTIERKIFTMGVCDSGIFGNLPEDANSSNPYIASIEGRRLICHHSGVFILSQDGGEKLSVIWLHNAASKCKCLGLCGVRLSKESAMDADSSVDINVNGWHSLIIKGNGSIVELWGDGNFINAAHPNITGIAAAIAAGRSHSVVVRNNGTVVAWGLNNVGQCNVPSAANNVIAVAAGNAHSLALKIDGTVVAWGDNSYGQSKVPTNLNHVVAIAAGLNHSIALKDDGTIVAWGDSSKGQTRVPAGLNGVVAIATGWFHTVALKHDGSVVVWGDNSYGQCNVPQGLGGVVSVSAGSYNTFAVEDTGKVVAWGDGGHGQTTIPDSLGGSLAAAAGLHHAIALTGIRQSIQFAPMAQVTYGTADFDPGATASSAFLVNYASSDTSIATIINRKVHIKKIGSVNITASQKGGASYVAAPSVTRNLSIVPKVLCVTGLSVKDKQYDGSVSAAVIYDSLVGVSPDDSVHLSFNGASFGDAGVGESKPVLLEGAQLTGRDAGNYSLAELNKIAANILPNSSAQKDGNSTAVAFANLAVNIPHPFASMAHGDGVGVLGTSTAGCGTGNDCLTAEVFLPGEATVTISVFDNLGVTAISVSKTVTESDLNAFEKRSDGSWVVPFNWNLRSSSGIAVPKGVYTWRISATLPNGKTLDVNRKLGVN